MLYMGLRTAGKIIWKVPGPYPRKGFAAMSLAAPSQMTSRTLAVPSPSRVSSTSLSFIRNPTNRREAMQISGRTRFPRNPPRDLTKENTAMKTSPAPSPMMLPRVPLATMQRTEAREKRPRSISLRVLWPAAGSSRKPAATGMHAERNPPRRFGLPSDPETLPPEPR